MKMDDVYDSLDKGLNKIFGKRLLAGNPHYDESDNARKEPSLDSPQADSSVMHDLLQITEGETVYKTREQYARLNGEMVCTGEVAPGDDMRVKSEGKRPVLRADYLQDLKEAADKNGQTLMSKFGMYEIHKNNIKEASVDQKGAIKFFNADVGGSMVQDYIKIAAKHKYSQSNKSIGLKLNTDIITDKDTAEKFFKNSIDTLTANGVEAHRIRIHNKEYQYIIDDYMKVLDKTKELNSSQKFEIVEGEVVASENADEEKKKNDSRLEGSFNLAAKSFMKDTTKEEMINAFKNTKVDVEFIKGGEYTKITKTGGEFETIVKTFDLVKGDFIKDTFANAEQKQEAKTEQQQDVKAEQKQEVQGVKDEPVKATEKKENETKKVQEKAAEPKEKPKNLKLEATKSVQAKMNNILIESKGNLHVLDELAKKSGIEIEFTNKNGVMKGFEVGNKDIVAKVDLTKTGEGKLLKSELTMNEDITFRQTVDAVKKGELKLDTKKTEGNTL